MTPEETAERVVDTMLAGDTFSKWLGLTIEKVSPGHCTVKMAVRKDMLNGFGVCHGGVPYALADSAMAFAANAHGRVSLLLDGNMSYPAKVEQGDVLTATAGELVLTGKIGVYGVRVTNAEGAIVAEFRGTVFRTEREFFPDDTD